MGSWFQLEFGCAEDAAWALVASSRVELTCREAVGINDRAAFCPAWAEPAVTSLRTVVTRLKVAACCAHAGTAATIVIANDNSPKVRLMAETLPRLAASSMSNCLYHITSRFLFPAVTVRSG
jgi:hypothetical protein